ncbi:hypothetical protein PAXINDRAFT_100853 [Paxillus involutus ATCC 200175]|uniref:WD40 repeat-like protein n=1 Tax=Paxillus involutus ATCC 200175 TaxID=664439 RepID=A0A0C9U160_PAXIN|nr:hypothetical protein PAXINDRAFT_100853 [Paxillus involutus ATCC 200175]
MPWTVKTYERGQQVFYTLTRSYLPANRAPSRLMDWLRWHATATRIIRYFRVTGQSYPMARGAQATYIGRTHPKKSVFNFPFNAAHTSTVLQPRDRDRPLALPSVDMHTSSRSVSPKIASIPPVVSNTGHPVPVQVLEDRDDWARCVCFYADESKVVSGSSDHTLRIWSRNTGAAQVLSGHTGWVWDVDVSRDGKMIVSGSSDKTVRIWNGESGETMYVFKGYGENVNSVEFSRDSSRVVSGCDDHTVRVWSVGTGEMAFEPIECHGRVLCVRYSPSGDRIASGGNSVQIWNAETGDRILSIRNSPVASLAWTADAAHLIGGGWGEVVIWNSDNGEQLRMWRAHGGLIRGLSLSPTAATHLATSNWWHKTAFIFDISTGEQVAALEHDGNVQGIAFSPSGRLIATGCEDNKLYLWEAPASEDPQIKASLILPFSSLPDRPAIPQAGSSRNDSLRPGLNPFSDRLLNRAQQAAPQPQRVFNRVRNTFANVFTRRRAIAAKTSPVRETARYRQPEDSDNDLPSVTGTNSSETAADNAATSNQLEPASDSVIRTQPQGTEMAAVLGHTSRAEQPGMTLGSLPTTAGNAVTSNQPESIEMVAISRSSIPLVIPPDPTVSAHASSQSTPPTDLPFLSVASRQASSTTVAVTSEPLSRSSNSARPAPARSSSHDAGVPISVTVSREELAIIQEVRRPNVIAASVTATADPLSNPEHDHKPITYPYPSTSLPRSPASVTQNTSLAQRPLFDQPRSRPYAQPSRTSVGLDPMPNVVPLLLSPSSLRPPHWPHPPSSNVRSLHLTASADDTLAEAPLGSAAQLAIRRSAPDEDID